MSFTINLYTNKSPANKVDKDLTFIAGATGVLKHDTSVVDPVLTVEASWDAGMIGHVNYAYIEEFGRYYFIENIVSVLGGLWEVYMHVDVLSSYKEQIRAQHAILRRSEKFPVMKFDDGWFSCYQNPIIQVINFSEEHPFDGEEYVLVVGGGAAGASQ